MTAEDDHGQRLQATLKNANVDEQKHNTEKNVSSFWWKYQEES